jgi:NAD(P)-dependent dehydrogenase (short-subunit alcohol dehydrogenase family)
VGTEIGVWRPDSPTGASTPTVAPLTTLDDMRTRQQPLDSGFGYRTDAHTVLAGHDLTGTTAVVTGGYSGLGLETVKALADAGARVIVPARRPEAAAATLADVPQATVAAMELSDLTSVAAFTESLRDTGDTVNLLVNAAGVMATPEQVTAQGWEFQFGTNHLGHFALTAGLAPLLADGARPERGSRPSRTSSRRPPQRSPRRPPAEAGASGGAPGLATRTARR